MAEQRLMRSRTDRRIAGVCGGLALYFEVDPVFVRLAFVAAVFVPPFAAAAIVGYIAAWIIVPEEPEPAEAAGASVPGAAGEAAAPEPGGFQPAEPGAFSESPPLGATAAPPAPRGGFPRDASLVGGIVFIALGVFFLLLNLGLLPWDIVRFWRWQVLWPVVVIVAGAVMLVRAVRMGGGRSDGA